MSENTGTRWWPRALWPALAIGIVLPALLMATVLLRGGRNLHSSMQYWAGLNFLIQSNDPTYEAIQSREDDVREIAALLWPQETSEERANEFYDYWRENKDWAMFNYQILSMDENEAGDEVETVHEVKSRYLLNARVRTELQESTWVNRDGRWFVRDQSRVVTGVVENPQRGVVEP